jgi:hypothetical protein
MTASIPDAELIAERAYGGRHTARVLCPYCGRTHLHLWPADAATALVAHCGAGSYTIGHHTEKRPR